MLEQVTHRYLDRIGYWRRVNAHDDHGDRQHAEHEEFAAVQVGQFCHVLVADITEDHAFDQPQGIGSAKDQGGSGQQTNPEIEFNRAQDNHEFADKTGSRG